MTVMITRESPDTADARRLVAELDAELEPLYARESRHGYSVDKLLAEGVSFFVTRKDGSAVGCGGIKLFGHRYAEIKRMYVRPQWRGTGLSKLMLDHLTSHARAHGIALLRLETGIHQRSAISLYERAGFQRVAPFGEYVEDPVSLCYERQL